MNGLLHLSIHWWINLEKEIWQDKYYLYCSPNVFHLICKMLHKNIYLDSFLLFLEPPFFLQIQRKPWAVLFIDKYLHWLSRALLIKQNMLPCPKYITVSKYSHIKILFWVTGCRGSIMLGGENGCFLLTAQDNALSVSWWNQENWIVYPFAGLKQPFYTYIPLKRNTGRPF